MMTIEEAIKELKDASYSETRYGDKDNHYDKVMKRVEAFEMAIKALEQQPCEDCISREAVDNYIVKLMSGYLYDEERTRLEDLTAYIWELPSVTPNYNSIKTELEPSEDCISREAVIKHICESKECYKDECKGRLYKRCFDLQWIYDLPSVTSQQTRWIPVSERLPEKSGEYWCTFRGTNLTGSDYYTTEADAKKLFDNPEEYIGWRSQNVIAWMPLPTVYRESEE